MVHYPIKAEFVFEVEQGIEEGKNYLMVHVSINGGTPEVIINPKENIPAKLAYYKEAYDDRMRLKANTNIQIIKATCVNSIRFD
jgi:hypothetical protein